MKTLSTAFRATASGDSNQPVELYDLYLDKEVISIVNYSQNVNFYDIDGNLRTYVAIPVSRDIYERNVENPINSISLGIANVDRSMSAYLAVNEFRGRRVVIRKVFADQLTSTGDYAIIFDGVMDTPSASEEAIQINAVDRIGSLNKEAPRLWFQLLCNRKFGDAGCFQGRTSGDMYGTVTGVCDAGTTAIKVISSSLNQANNYWEDGEIQVTSGENSLLRRKVVSSNQGETSANLSYSLPYVPVVGDTFTIRRGCDKTHFRCSGDFNNDANFLGFDTIPQQMIVRVIILFLLLSNTFL